MEKRGPSALPDDEGEGIVERRIYHVDMDAFFASVEQRDNPRLRGLPVIVGGDGRRGVVAAASYEARRAGVRSAMPAGRARRLCPDAVFVPPRHAHYRAVSAILFEILHAWSDRVEGVSVDEAYLDMSAALADYEVLANARALKRRISAEIGLTASIGIGSSKLVAKLASAYDKPDGLTWVRPGREREFLDPLPVGQLQGVGPATGARLQDAGILTIGQLRRTAPELLQPVFGRQAGRFMIRAGGIDDREVRGDRERRSISQESTFDADLVQMEAVEAVIWRQAGKCAQVLREKGLFARVVRIKLRSGGFSTLTRSVTLAGWTRSADVIAAAAIDLARAWARYQTRLSLRLVGVGVGHLAAAPASDEVLAAATEQAEAPESSPAESSE
jgi:DNA polymerase-4